MATRAVQLRTFARGCPRGVGQLILLVRVGAAGALRRLAPCRHHCTSVRDRSGGPRRSRSSSTRMAQLHARARGRWIAAKGAGVLADRELSEKRAIGARRRGGHSVDFPEHGAVTTTSKFATLATEAQEIEAALYAAAHARDAVLNHSVASAGALDASVAHVDDVDTKCVERPRLEASLRAAALSRGRCSAP